MLVVFVERVAADGAGDEEGRHVAVSPSPRSRVATGGSLPVTARAHFVLQAPPSWAAQDGVGSPQKSAPCGQADPGQAAVSDRHGHGVRARRHRHDHDQRDHPHPGHYRVVAVDDGPERVAGGSAGDGRGDRSLRLDGDPEPAGVPACSPTGCSRTPTPVQRAADVHGHAADRRDLRQLHAAGRGVHVDHGLNNPGGCFYHHCADISIQQGGGGGNDAGPVEPGGSSSGCGCAVGDPRASLGGVLLLLAVVAVRRRAPPLDEGARGGGLFVVCVHVRLRRPGGARGDARADGTRAYRAGRFADALAAFETAARQQPVRSRARWRTCAGAAEAGTQRGGCRRQPQGDSSWRRVGAS